MSHSYGMVFINCIASLLLIAGILFYRYWYPKKKINLFVLLLFISILPLLSLLRPGDYESGDFNIHLYRIMSFYDTLKEGYLLPSWAAELNATYGNPLFIFNYSLPYYTISLFHLIGISFIASMKLYLGSTLFFSGIFMFLWIKKLTGSNLAAFTSAIFYLFNPYHLIDVHFRATLGESTVFTLSPLLFYCITQYLGERKFLFLPACSLLTGLLFLAHPLLSGAVLAIAVLYATLISITKNAPRLLLFIILSLLAGVLASQYTWVSFFLYSPYTFHLPSQSSSFYPFYGLLYSPWLYGFLFQGHHGELALIIGYTQILIVLASAIIFIKTGMPKTVLKHHLFWFCTFLFLVFLMHPSSMIIWNFFPTFSPMFIPYGRLLLPIAICTSVLAGYFVLAFAHSQTKKILVYLLILITIGSTILNWGHRRVIPEINDSVLQKGVWKSTVTEGVTAYFLNNRWADINNFWFSALPKQHLEITQGKGTVKQMQRSSTEHVYVVTAQTPLTIQENTLYFPGWSLKSNDKTIPIYPGKRGVIHAKLPKGRQYLKLTYTDIPLYKLSKTASILSFSSIVLLLLLCLLPWRIKKALASVILTFSGRSKTVLPANISTR